MRERESVRGEGRREKGISTKHSSVDPVQSCQPYHELWLSGQPFEKHVSRHGRAVALKDRDKVSTQPPANQHQLVKETQEFLQRYVGL